MDSWIIQNDVFFSHILQEINMGNSVKIPVKGNSMLPFIRPLSDEIELKPLSDRSIEKGNIVLAKTSEEKYIVHRIEKVDQNKITLRGDGNIAARELCDKNNIFAEVTTIHKKNRTVKKDTFEWNFAKNYWFSNPFLRRVFLAIYRRI